MKKKIAFLAVVIAITLALVSIKLLPDVIVIQVGFDGAIKRTAPKLLGVFAPLIITFAGSLMFLSETGDNKKSVVLILLGYLINALNFFFNL